MWKGSRVNPTFLSWWQIFWVDFMSKRFTFKKKKSSWAHPFAFPKDEKHPGPHPTFPSMRSTESLPAWVQDLAWSPTQACLGGGCPETSLKLAEKQSSSVSEDCSLQMRARERSCPAAGAAQHTQQTKVGGESVGDRCYLELKWAAPQGVPQEYSALCGGTAVWVQSRR